MSATFSLMPLFKLRTGEQSKVSPTLSLDKPLDVLLEPFGLGSSLVL